MDTLINKVQTNLNGYHMLLEDGCIVCATNLETLLVRADKKRKEITTTETNNKTK